MLYLNVNSTSMQWDGTDTGLWLFGTIVMHNVVMVVNIKMLMTTRYWTWPLVLSVLACMFIFWMGWVVIYCIVPALNM
jgi:Phospholipid-translocating P-type ATPase C-terminal